MYCPLHSRKDPGDLAITPSGGAMAVDSTSTRSNLAETQRGFTMMQVLITVGVVTIVSAMALSQ